MPAYKYCIVPNCVNSSTISPNKLYFRVPHDAKARAKWCKVMRRTDRTPLPAKSALYCCEDHFDIETDMKDYKKYKMLGGKLRLKQGVVPHKFACQHMKKDIILIKLPVNKKQKQIELFEKALNTKIKPENITEVPVEFIKCEPIDKTETDSIGGSKIKCETTDTDEKNPVGGMKIKCEQIDIDETNPVGGTNIDKSNEQNGRC